MPSEPKRKSWSYLPIRWALRSMWKSLPLPQGLRHGVVNDSPHIVSCANSGLSPTMSGHSSSPMNASACPTVGRKMSPRGSLGLGSSAKRRS